MTVEKEMELRAEYMNCRTEVGWCLIVMIASAVCFFFCALKGFLPGVVIGLGIQIYFMHRAEKYQDRMKEIRWEVDRG